MWLGGVVCACMYRGNGDGGGGGGCVFDVRKGHQNLQRNTVPHCSHYLLCSLCVVHEGWTELLNITTLGLHIPSPLKYTHTPPPPCVLSCRHMPVQVKAVREEAARREATLQAALDEARARLAAAGGGGGGGGTGDGRCVCGGLLVGFVAGI